MDLQTHTARTMLPLLLIPILIHGIVGACPEYDAPPTVCMRRLGDQLVVTCPSTKESWYLICRDDKWIGDVGTCPPALPLTTVTPPEVEVITGEYCDTEVFRPSCPSGKLIKMETAFYGRMKLGRCVKINLGYIGCRTDVLDIMNQACSGQQSCEMPIPSAVLENNSSCLSELKVYLEASYQCVQAFPPTPTQTFPLTTETPPVTIMRGEHCEAEEFRPSCPSGKVIKMETALYGRMNVGRCIKTDLGYVGCYADVVDILSQLCSGHQTCEMTVPNADLEGVHPCPSEYGSYLETGYQCVEAIISTPSTQTIPQTTETPQVQIMTGEYCGRRGTEGFGPACPSGKLITMETALYGRMKMGRCIRREHGYIGCYENVVDIMDRHCSGRQFCRIDSLIDLLNAKRPCPIYLVSYLEVNYQCIEGQPPPLTSIEPTSQIISGEYCPWETFRASCPSGKVVKIETAFYGRMKLGRCVKNDLGYIGCTADVLSTMDTLCSGRQSCELNIPDPNLHQSSSCPDDLISYLEASYQCLEELQPEVVVERAFYLPEFLRTRFLSRKKHHQKA